MKVLGLIPARAGSKGLPHKNTRPLGEKPLVAWTLEAARSARLDRVIVSSDDEAVWEAARSLGVEVPFARPAALATDEASMVDVVLHALDTLATRGEVYDAFVLLQPTSPLRLASDIDAALALFVESDAPSVTSVVEPSKSPYWMYSLDFAGRLVPLLGEALARTARRQDLPPAYALNGALYVCDVAWFRRERVFVNAETAAYVMPPERSADVDHAADLEFCEWLLSRRHESGRTH